MGKLAQALLETAMWAFEELVIEPNQPVSGKVMGQLKSTFTESMATVSQVTESAKRSVQTVINVIAAVMDSPASRKNFWLLYCLFFEKQTFGARHP